jgi:hypothetical protein
MYLKHWSDPAANRAELRRRIEEALVELTEREERLRTGREAVERSVAEEKALLIADPQVARLWIRYHAESNSAYFRASRELLRSLAEDEAIDHPEHPIEEASERPAMACSPNEANHPTGEALNEELAESSDTSAAVILQPILGTTGATPSAPESSAAPVPRETLAAVTSEPAPEAANDASPNEANEPVGVQLTLGDIKAYAESLVPLVGPCAAAVVTTIEAMVRPGLDAARRAHLGPALERDLAALDAELMRRKQRVA